jgi:acetyl esterase/lipase
MVLAILVCVWIPAISVAQQPSPPQYELIRDLPYPNDGSAYARERCKLDLYLPKDQENFPILVWFHGGALRTGDKTESYATGVAKRFASEGIGVALPNYRLYTYGARYPQFIEDAASAAAWVYQNISDYHGNPKHLFIGGHSSGAYLAAMIGVDDRYLKKHDLSLQQIAGVIPLSGEMYGDSSVWWAEHEIYKTYTDKTTLFQVNETTPMFYVRHDVLPPFLCFCAEHHEDPPEIVCAENQRFIEALRAAGHDQVMFKEIPDRTHFSVTEMQAPDDPVVTLMLSFMHRIIAGE